MQTETETKMGECSTHGVVEGRREIPRIAFPFIVFGVLRMLARRKPFACPTCGKSVT